MTISSDCCAARIVNVDICSDCGEHCETYCDECGNSGVIFDHSHREWENCECGHPYSQIAAEIFHCALDDRDPSDFYDDREFGN